MAPFVLSPGTCTVNVGIIYTPCSTEQKSIIWKYMIVKNVSSIQKSVRYWIGNMNI